MTPTFTATVGVPSETPTVSGGASSTPVSTATFTTVPTNTDTPVPVPTNTPVPVPTNTPVPVNTDTPIPSDTPVPSVVPPSETPTEITVVEVDEMEFALIDEFAFEGGI